MTKDQVVEAMKDAERRGMIPFVVVLPVSPELLRDVADPSSVVAHAASDAMRGAVESYRREHLG